VTGEEKPPTAADIMLNYVAVTRAMNVLDPGPLAPSKGVWSDEEGDDIDPSADAGLLFIADEGQIAEGGA
jgi:hypothetical protein